MKDNVIKVLKVEPKKKPEICLLKNDLKSLQEAVGGLIEIISLDVGVALLCNEEGKLIGLEPNRRLGSDIIVGTFYVLGDDENGVLKSISEEDAEYYAEIFKDFEEISQEEVDESMVMHFIAFEEE